MKTVNPYLLHTMLEPLAGLADDDDDDVVERYRSLDSNNESRMREVIRQEIVPHLSTFSVKDVERIKATYRYYLSKADSKWERVFYSLLIPFDAPSDPRLFFVWIWNECWPEERFELSDRSEFIEHAEINTRLDRRNA